MESPTPQPPPREQIPSSLRHPAAPTFLACRGAHRNRHPARRRGAHPPARSGPTSRLAGIPNQHPRCRRPCRRTAHILVLLGAGLVTGAGQIVLKQLTSANGIDTTAAIWFHAGRLPAVRTLGSAILSIFVVAMGGSLGREGAPNKPAWSSPIFSPIRAASRTSSAACWWLAEPAREWAPPMASRSAARFLPRSDARNAGAPLCPARAIYIPDRHRRLLAGAAGRAHLPHSSLFQFHFGSALDSAGRSIAGVASVGYVRMISWADRNRPHGWRRLAAPLVVLGLLGLVSIPYPQLLGNGKDISEILFTAAPGLVLLLPLRCSSRQPPLFACAAARRGASSPHPSPPERCWASYSAALAMPLARRPGRTIRAAWRGSRSGRHHAGAGLGRSAADGAHRSRPVVPSAAPADRRNRDHGSADDRTPLGLRCSPER